MAKMCTVSRLERQFATLCLFHAPTGIGGYTRGGGGGLADRAMQIEVFFLRLEWPFTELENGPRPKIAKKKAAEMKKWTPK